LGCLKYRISILMGRPAIWSLLSGAVEEKRRNADSGVYLIRRSVLFILYWILMRRMSEGRSDVQYMLRTVCRCIYLEQQVPVTDVISRPSGILVGEDKVISQWMLWRINSELLKWIRIGNYIRTGISNRCIDITSPSDWLRISTKNLNVNNYFAWVFSYGEKRDFYRVLRD
jgi:hypothetical protein